MSNNTRIKYQDSDQKQKRQSNAMSSIDSVSFASPTNNKQTIILQQSNIYLYSGQIKNVKQSKNMNVNHQFSPNLAVVDNRLIESNRRDKFYQNNSLKNSNKNLFSYRQNNNQQQQYDGRSSLGNTKLSPNQQHMSMDTQIIRNKLAQLNSLPQKAIQRMRNEEQQQQTLEQQSNVTDIYQYDKSTINFNINSSGIQGQGNFNKIETFKKLKDQFWQQSRRSNTTNNNSNNLLYAQQNQFGNVDHSIITNNNNNPNNATYQLYYKINNNNYKSPNGINPVTQFNNGDINNMKQTSIVSHGGESRVLHGIGYPLQHPHTVSGNTSRSNSPSHMRSSRVTKLVYKVQPNDNKAIQNQKQPLFKLPDLKSVGQSNYNPNGYQNNNNNGNMQYHRQSINASPSQNYQQPTFLTSNEIEGGYNRKKVEIKDLKIQGKPKNGHPIEFSSNQIHLNGYQDQLLERQNIINAAISSQIENFDNCIIPTSSLENTHGQGSYRYTNNNSIDNTNKNINELNSIQDIEQKLLKDIANCKVCQQKYNKAHLKTIEDKQVKNDLLSLQAAQNDIGGGGVKTSSQRAVFKDHNSAFTPKAKVDEIHSVRLINKLNKDESRLSSLPKILDKRGSNSNLLLQTQSNFQKTSRDFSANNQRNFGKIDQQSTFNSTIMKQNQYSKHLQAMHPGYSQFIQHLNHCHMMHSDNPLDSEDDGDKFMSDLTKEELIPASSFLRLQEQRMEFRQKVKDQFEKGEIDQDEFDRLVLLNIRNHAESVDVTKEVQNDKPMPGLTKKSTLAFGGLGLKFREKIIKESENANNGKFYDFLMTLRDRENLLSQSLRDVSKPKYKEKTREMVLEYLKECEKQRAVPLAQAVTQIKNQQYFLSDYQLNEGIVKALCQSINLSRDKLVKLTLSHNQVSDEQFSYLLSSLNENQLNSVKSIVYCNKNEFGLKSFQSLNDKYLSKVPPFQLEELRIANCKVMPGSVNNILEILKDTCFLKKLSIPKTKLNEYSVDMIVQLISKQSAPNLIELDISWNEIGIHSISKIIKALPMNDRLQNLNISWNEVREEIDIKPLGQFIRHNPNIIHLDLSKMFSSESHIKYLIKSIRKAHSLQSLHLSSTPIIRKSKRLYNYILRKLKAIEAPDKKQKKPNVHQLYKNDWKEQIRTQFMCKQGEKELHEYTCYNINQSQVVGNAENFIISRVLGHPEMPGSDQWTISKECYICGRWQYTVFMKVHEKQQDISSQQNNPFAGMFGGGKSLLQKKPQQQQQQQSQQETLICDQNVQMRVKGSYESYQNKRPSTMINILKFAQILDPNYISAEQKFEEVLQNLDQNTLNLMQKNQAIKDQKFYDVKKEVEEYYKENWKQIVKKGMRFKNIQFIPESLNFDKANENFYVFADFLKPSNVFEQVIIQNSQPQMFFPQIRKEELVPITGFKRREAQFEDKHANVFAEWKVDTEAILDEVLENDFKYWKVSKFVKDPKDMEEIERIFRENLRPLKDIYLTMISLSNYPNLTWLDFVNFIKSSNIIDERTSMATVDRLFIAANVEIVDIEENPDRALCRYELWEILVRIAAQKFKEANLAETYHQSLEKLLDNNILKYSMALPWQQFRDEELWVRDVNLVFDANMDAVSKLYKKYFQPKQNWISLQDAVNLMTKESRVELSYKDATFAYGMSKMTVKNEMEKGQNPYKKMVLVEFLEFIGRCAALKYKRSSEPLYMKIEKILDLILPVVSMIRKEIVRRVEIPYVESDESVLDQHLEDENENLQHQQSSEEYLHYFSVLNGGKYFGSAGNQHNETQRKGSLSDISCNNN